MSEIVETLQAENAALRAEVAELMDALAETVAENEEMGRVFDADDQLKAAMAEVTRQRALAENAERTLNARTAEFNQRANDLAYWKKRAGRAEQALSRGN